MEQEITGTIKDALINMDDNDPRAPNITGKIYGDIRHRFEDGSTICTSTIQEHLPGNIIKTRYSTYKIEWA